MERAAGSSTGLGISDGDTDKTWRLFKPVRRIADTPLFLLRSPRWRARHGVLVDKSRVVDGDRLGTRNMGTELGRRASDPVRRVSRTTLTNDAIVNIRSGRCCMDGYPG